MQKQKGFANIALIIIIILIAGGVGYYLAKQGRKTQKEIEKTPADGQVESIVQCNPTILGEANSLVSFSIASCDNVSGIQHISAEVQGGWFFEANILINILDENFNSLPYGPGHATTTANWMTAGPVPFEFDVDFTPMPKGLTYIEIRNDNPSGDPQYDKYIHVPVIVN